LWFWNGVEAILSLSLEDEAGGHAGNKHLRPFFLAAAAAAAAEECGIMLVSTCIDFRTS